MVRRITRLIFWLLLCVPAALMLRGLINGSTLPMDLLHPSGEMSVRLMILAMLPGPLADAFGARPFLRRWLSVRRNLGVAAFGYALLHLMFYVIDMGQFAAMVDELGLPGIWSGWLALGLMLPPAAISFDRAMRGLGRHWKKIQRLVYAALIASLAHWFMLDWKWQPAAIHLSPLMLAWLLRGWRGRRKLERNRS